MAECYVTNPDLPKSTKSHLMKVLREAGIVRNEPEGRRRVLSLRKDGSTGRSPGCSTRCWVRASRLRRPLRPLRA
ncbi:hypothetical protein [Aeromicrobium sp. UC242_57]|uniref:hypothetical protein n=1 Tax=Aeromicrobium sp. UC242_57 TaxID=3374624 RepID=UPI0037BB52DF